MIINQQVEISANAAHIPETLEGCLEILLPRWVSENAGCLAPASDEQVRQTFAELGFSATSDVVYLYSVLGGMDYADKEWWALWDLNRIREENSEPGTYGLLFSDYMLSCWCYIVKANDDDTSSVYLHNHPIEAPTLIASSLLAFFQMYLTNATALLDARSQQYVK